MLWFFLLMILFIFILLQSQPGFFYDGQNSTDKHTKALKALNERYACGELNEDEYNKIKKNIRI